jgi:hypothetical protein
MGFNDDMGLMFNTCLGKILGASIFKQTNSVAFSPQANYTA